MQCVGCSGRQKGPQMPLPCRVTNLATNSIVGQLAFESTWPNQGMSWGIHAPSWLHTLQHLALLSLPPPSLTPHIQCKQGYLKPRLAVIRVIRAWPGGRRGSAWQRKSPLQGTTNTRQAEAAAAAVRHSEASNRVHRTAVN